MAIRQKEAPPETLTVGYVGQQEELLYTRWEVPYEVIYPPKGKIGKGGLTPTAWIEREAKRQQKAKEDAAAQREADKQRAARQAEQQATAAAEAREAEETAAAEAKADDDRRRKRQLKDELKADVDRLASANLQAAAALQAKEQVISDRVDESEARINGLIETVDERIAEMMVLRDELDERITQMQQAEGSNSLGIYGVKRELQAIKKQLNL